MKSRSTAVLTIVLCGAICGFAQTAPPQSAQLSGFEGTSILPALSKGELKFAFEYRRPELREESISSVLMGRSMPYRVILPARYSDPKNTNRRYPVLYLLHGLTGRYNNWTDLTKIDEVYATDDLIIVTPEGENGWYTDSAAKPADKYESYIVKELIPAIDKKFRTSADRQGRAIAGLSMGGYGAIKFGLKYPDMFSLSGSFSGALGAASITEKDIPGAIGKTIESIFGPAGSDARKANDVFDMIRRSTPEKVKDLPFLYLDCGTEDFLFQNNREFVALLLEKKVPHEFRQLPGAHNWKYWDAQVEQFLHVVRRRVNATR
jgi:putative tributyrin esterase